MTQAQTVILGLVVVCSLLVLAGCQGGAPLGSGSISVEYNESAISDEPATFDATVKLELSVNGSVTFEDVIACAYGEDGEIIRTDSVGTLTTPTDSGRIEFDSRVPPAFIVVDHPKLAEFDALGPMILRWDESRQQYEQAGTEDMTFEYRSPGEPGTCGTAA